MQNGHWQPPETVRDVLDCAWGQCHHRPPLLPPQWPSRKLLGGSSGGLDFHFYVAHPLRATGRESACWGADASIAYTRTFVSTIPGSMNIIEMSCRWREPSAPSRQTGNSAGVASGRTWALRIRRIVSFTQCSASVPALAARCATCASSSGVKSTLIV